MLRQSMLERKPRERLEDLALSDAGLAGDDQAERLRSGARRLRGAKREKRRLRAVCGACQLVDDSSTINFAMLSCPPHYASAIHKLYCSFPVLRPMLNYTKSSFDMVSERSTGEL